MHRPELHRRRRTPDALSRPPARPRLDAVAWNAAHEVDAQLDRAVEDLESVLEKARRAQAQAKSDGRAA